MKRFHIIPLIAAVLLLAPGCSTKLEPDGPYNNALLFNADRTITSSYRVIHAFVTWEMAHRDVLPAEVTKAADFIRANAESWIDQAIAAREVYALAPTKANQSQLMRTISILDDVLNQIALHLATNIEPKG